MIEITTRMQTTHVMMRWVFGVTMGASNFLAALYVSMMCSNSFTSLGGRPTLCRLVKTSSRSSTVAFLKMASKSISQKKVFVTFSDGICALENSRNVAMSPQHPSEILIS